jgi:hypothetical protein
MTIYIIVKQNELSFEFMGGRGGRGKGHEYEDNTIGNIMEIGCENADWMRMTQNSLQC